MRHEVVVQTPGYKSSKKKKKKRTTHAKIFLQQFYLSFFFARNLLRGSRRRNIYRFSFWCLIWDLNSGPMSNKSTHYRLRRLHIICYNNLKSNTKFMLQKGAIYKRAHITDLRSQKIFVSLNYFSTSLEYFDITVSDNPKIL